MPDSPEHLQISLIELQAAVYLDTSPPVAGFLQVSELKVVI
jgi:hypothetical protein